MLTTDAFNQGLPTYCPNNQTTRHIKPPTTQASNDTPKLEDQAPHPERFRFIFVPWLKLLGELTGPPAPFVLGLLCIFTIWLSYRSNNIAQQALIEARKQTALAEWSAALQFKQFCETNASRCASVLDSKVFAPPFPVVEAKDVKSMSPKPFGGASLRGFGGDVRPAGVLDLPCTDDASCGGPSIASVDSTTGGFDALDMLASPPTHIVVFITAVFFVTFYFAALVKAARRSRKAKPG